jgi:adenine-specific DNA methylase
LNQQKLIERTFPLYEINLLAEYEMLFLKMIPRELKQKMIRLLSAHNLVGRNLPKIHNLMYYPARIPPSATRATTLASILNYDSSLSKEIFLRALGLDNAKSLARESGAIVTLYMADPNRDLIRDLVKKQLGKNPEEITVADPMAGGGSIPLEALRLGFRTIAGDYNPVAYLILRATIEFPAKYGRKLLLLLEQEAKELLRYIREELGRFYDENVARLIYFIGAEHSCEGIIPLIRQAMLSRSKKIYVKPIFDKERKELTFQISSQPPTYSPSPCPYCGRPVTENEIREKWVKEHIAFIEDLLDGKVERAKDSSKIYILGTVQLGKGKYRAPTDKDIQLLIEACEELARSALKEKEEGRDIRDYIPIAEIPQDNEVFNGLRGYGFRYWYQLFAPRQLLVLYKVVKYLRNRAEVLVKQYGELGAAVVLYLTMALSKELDYNNILTQWHPGSEVVRDLAGSQYALGRSADLGYDFAEGNFVYKTFPWALEAEEEEGEDKEEEEVESTRGGILPVVRFLCNRLDGLWKDGLDAVYMWDARQLDKYLPEKSVDLINVDPPYYDQHDYAGITEFFWVIMQQALWPVLDVLFPRDRVRVDGWSPYDPEVPRGIEIRGRPVRMGVSEFGEGFKQFLEAASKVLKDDGLLVVWYAYGRLEGWEELFRLFYETGYGVTKTWQVWSQSRQRRVALQKAAFFTSMVIVARPRYQRRVIVSYNDPVFIDDVRNSVEQSMDTLVSMYGLDVLKEAFVTSIADGFSRATLFTLPSVLAVWVNLSNRALDVSVSTILNYLARKVARVGMLDIAATDPITRLYIFALMAATPDLSVSSDFINRVSQALAANAQAIVRAASRGSARILSPEEVASRYQHLLIGKSLRLIQELVNTVSRLGVRAAENIVMQNDRSAVELAKLLVAVAWDKLKLNEDTRETLLTILSKGVAA